MEPIEPTAAEQAAVLEQRAAALETGDSSSYARASELWAEAGGQWRVAGNDSATAAAFDRAGRASRLAGDTSSAFRHYGTSIQTRDPSTSSQIRDVLATAPAGLRGGPNLEAAFVGKARALLVALGILNVAGAEKSVRSTVDAFARLEELGAAHDQVRIRLVLADGLQEARMRRWISRFRNAPWMTVRDSILIYPPMHYEFCYIDPRSHEPMVINQPCADGCKVALPSDHAMSAEQTSPPCVREVRR